MLNKPLSKERALEFATIFAGRTIEFFFEGDHKKSPTCNGTVIGILDGLVVLSHKPVQFAGYINRTHHLFDGENFICTFDDIITYENYDQFSLTAFSRSKYLKYVCISESKLPLDMYMFLYGFKNIHTNTQGRDLLQKIKNKQLYIGK